MKRTDLSKRLVEADRRSVWAFTPASFDALVGPVQPNYLKLMMKRLKDQGVLIRAARGVYVNPLARSLPSDVRRGLTSAPKLLYPKYLYYELGSRLFSGHACAP